MAATADIIARLKLNAQNFTSEIQKELGNAERKFGSSGSVIGRNLSQSIGGGLQDATSRIPVLGSALSGLSGPALIAAAGVGAIVGTLALGVSNAEALERSIRKLDASIGATNRTGFSKQQLVDYSDEMETRLAITQESIIKTEAVLATFDGVSGKTFKGAMEAAADMSAVFGGDLTDNATKLGTVLQNLAEGRIEGLRKGFRFLGTDTNEAIEHLAKVGRTAEAQEKLLAALQARIGGGAEADAHGVAGSFFRLKDSIGDVTREFTKQIGLYGAVEGGFGRLADKAERLSGTLKGMGSDEFWHKIWQAPANLLSAPMDALTGHPAEPGHGIAAPRPAGAMVPWTPAQQQ
ncbi:MAG: hypothetical protein QOH86_1170, partial [Sphingomonadales bacterium]|nr:hypothetical protein [Sphingomonadales bacterium]